MRDESKKVSTKRARNSTIMKHKMAHTIFHAFLLASCCSPVNGDEEKVAGSDGRSHYPLSSLELRYVSYEVFQFRSIGSFIVRVSEWTVVRFGKLADRWSESWMTQTQQASERPGGLLSGLALVRYGPASLSNSCHPLQCLVYPDGGVCWKRRSVCNDSVTAFPGTLSVMMVPSLHAVLQFTSRGCRLIQTAGVGSFSTAGTMTVATLCSLSSSGLHVTIATGFAGNASFFYTFTFHQRTNCILISPETVHLVKQYPNVTGAVVELLRKSRCQLLTTKGELATTIACSSLLWHDYKSIKNCFICLLYRPFISARHLKHKLLMYSRVYNVKVCVNASSAQKLSPSDVSPLNYRYVVHVLYLLVSMLCILDHLCKKIGKKQYTKSSKKRTMLSDTWHYIPSSKICPSNVDSHCPNKPFLSPRSNLLYDIIHHPWRIAPQRSCNTNPQPSIMTKQCRHFKCLCSVSTLCDVCENLVSHYLRHEERTNTSTDSKPLAGSSQETRSNERSSLHVYPVTRFLPDPTRNPSQDLCHVGYRLATLGALPSSFPVSRVRLADAGFYFRGDDDEVTCYSCHVRHSGWTRDDNPLEVHRRLSPGCPHLQMDQMTAGTSSGCGSARAARSVDGTHGNSMAANGSRSTDAPQSSTNYSEDGERSSPPTNSEHDASTSHNAATNETRAPAARHNNAHGSIPATRSTENRSAVRADAGPGNNSATATGRTDTPSSARVGTDHVGNGSILAPPVPNRGAGETSGAADHSSTTLAAGTPGTRSLPAERGSQDSPIVVSQDSPIVVSQDRPIVVSQDSPIVVAFAATTMNGSSVTPASDAGRQLGSSGSDSPPRFLFPRPGLELGGAVYPMYQDMASRRRSFTVPWNESQAPPFMDVLLCGMFYAGYRDCVRCFYCGVGLKNWVVTDNVWDEHVRWRPECQYLRRVKGDDFIRNTQRRLGVPANAERNSSGSASATGQRQQQPTRTSANTAGTTSAATPPPSSAEATSTSTSSAASATAATSQGQDPGSRGRPGRGSCSSSDRGGDRGADRPGGDRGDTGTVEMNAGNEQRSLARVQAENRTLARNLDCRICHRASVDTIFLPCGHLVVCEICARSVTTCPLCAVAVQATARVYMA